jgi:hypothetical protein
MEKIKLNPVPCMSVKLVIEPMAGVVVVWPFAMFELVEVNNCININPKTSMVATVDFFIPLSLRF